ncbi:uncharacterized protein [Temnothorax nylanderi]|uniref:uncharacterized protein n=1 Tax=Temnothorax nylanderi TaxID=102681 RepID=UPI003A87C02E
MIVTPYLCKLCFKYPAQDTRLVFQSSPDLRQGTAKENRSLIDLTEEEESMNLSMQTQENTFDELKISKVWSYVNNPVGRFVCSRCGRSYTRRNTLQRHEQWECGKEPRFKCPFCPQRCKRKTHWQRHIREQHYITDKADMEEYLHSNNQPKLKFD